jgi:hypothetical protein
MWVCAAIGTIFIKDAGPYASALIGTFIMGIGYVVANNLF